MTMEIDYAEIGRRIFSLRTSRRPKISRAMLSEKIGVSDTSIYRWENGLDRPELVHLAKVSDYFNVPLAYLLGEAELPSLSALARGEVKAPEPQLTLTAQEAKELIQETVQDAMAAVPYFKDAEIDTLKAKIRHLEQELALFPKDFMAAWKAAPEIRRAFCLALILRDKSYIMDLEFEACPPKLKAAILASMKAFGQSSG